jgi:hypothetical protein
MRRKAKVPSNGGIISLEFFFQKERMKSVGLLSEFRF